MQNLPTLATLRAESAIVHTKEALFARFDRTQSIDVRLQTAQLCAEFFGDIAKVYPAEACAWARELWRKVFYLYSEPDQLYFDRGRKLARLFGVCHEMIENLEAAFTQLQAAA